MLYVQLAILFLGVVLGLTLAAYLRRIAPRYTRRQRVQTAIGFGAGAAMWIVWAAFFTDLGPIGLTFLATVAAVYVPCLVVLLQPAAPPAERSNIS